MSSINTNNIDKNFPQPGKDNDSIGFRNNFSEIADNLDAAKTEITDLENNVVRTDRDNDLNGQKIKDADLFQITDQVYDLTDVSSDTSIDFTNGSYQTVTVTDDINFTLAGWPASGRKAKIEVQVTSDGSNRTVTWTPEAGGNLKINQNSAGGWPDPFVVSSASDPLLVEFVSIDGGVTVYATYKGQFS
jgi:hypothetical protein